MLLFEMQQLTAANAAGPELLAARTHKQQRLDAYIGNVCLDMRIAEPLCAALATEFAAHTEEILLLPEGVTHMASLVHDKVKHAHNKPATIHYRIQRLHIGLPNNVEVLLTKSEQMDALLGQEAAKYYGLQLLTDASDTTIGWLALSGNQQTAYTASNIHYVQNLLEYQESLGVIRQALGITT